MDCLTNTRLANCEVPLLDRVEETGEYRLIIAVWGFDKMNTPCNNTVRVVAGNNQLRVDGAYRASLVGRIHNLLESYGVQVNGIEQSEEKDSFALLIHATIAASEGLNIAALRTELVEEARKLGVTLRIQREEVFAYMHRV